METEWSLKLCNIIDMTTNKICKRNTMILWLSATFWKFWRLDLWVWISLCYCLFFTCHISTLSERSLFLKDCNNDQGQAEYPSPNNDLLPPKNTPNLVLLALNSTNTLHHFSNHQKEKPFFFLLINILINFVRAQGIRH